MSDDEIGVATIAAAAPCRRAGLATGGERAAVHDGVATAGLRAADQASGMRGNSIIVEPTHLSFTDRTFSCDPEKNCRGHIPKLRGNSIIG